MARDWDVKAGELSAQAYADGEPTAWFDRLYAAGDTGQVSMPWDREEPQAQLREWLERHDVRGEGRRAVVVGCGLGADAEHLASLGFVTTAFDVAPTAVRVAHDRHPGSSVDYHVADLLALPPDWAQAFDLVVEVFTVQALPDPPRTAAAAAVGSLVAPGGTLLVVQFRHVDDTGETLGPDSDEGPPFAIGRDRIASLAAGGLELAEAEELPGERWRATYRR